MIGGLPKLVRDKVKSYLLTFNISNLDDKEFDTLTKLILSRDYKFIQFGDIYLGLHRYIDPQDINYLDILYRNYGKIVRITSYSSGYLRLFYVYDKFINTSDADFWHNGKYAHVHYIRFII